MSDPLWLLRVSISSDFEPLYRKFWFRHGPCPPLAGANRRGDVFRSRICLLLFCTHFVPLNLSRIITRFF